MMIQVTIAEAQVRLPDLLAAVKAGESVAICSNDGQTFQLVDQPPIPLINPAWPGYPHPGSAKGLIHFSDDFDEPRLR